jgi:hypothetical protein
MKAAISEQTGCFPGDQEASQLRLDWGAPKGLIHLHNYMVSLL